MAGISQTLWLEIFWSYMRAGVACIPTGIIYGITVKLYGERLYFLIPCLVVGFASAVLWNRKVLGRWVP